MAGERETGFAGLLLPALDSQLRRVRDYGDHVPVPPPMPSGPMPPLSKCPSRFLLLSQKVNPQYATSECNSNVVVCW